ncbi:MAG: tyrosine-type recombinase/integrase [Azospirillum sp.]|nr:tyrosine-type recombinase/integrase [Azospirillum sp.]
MKKEFKQYLINQNLSKNTINSYLFTFNQLNKMYDISYLTKKKLLDYKMYLIENYRPQTVNLRIRGVNCYLESIQKEQYRLSTIKVQTKNYLENVISEADYEYLKRKLRRYDKFWYFVIRFMAATGARVSELVQIKAEHIKIGYLDLYSKGGKLRRIYIPIKLQTEALKWLEERNLNSGFIFLNRFGERITPRGIAGQLKVIADKYGIDKKVVYPHSFRHRFAKNFLSKFNDISLLADLMGHESIETTRIYLRRTSTEQQKIVNEVIDW